MRIRSWPFWILVVFVVSGPWFGIVREPQWERVTWIPFTGSSDKPRDMIVNFMLFVPFGWSFIKSRTGAHGILLAMTAAAAVSMAVEVPQLFYRLRDPSATDLLMADLRRRRRFTRLADLLPGRRARRAGPGARQARAAASSSRPAAASAETASVVRVSNSTACSSPRDELRARRRPTTTPAGRKSEALRRDQPRERAGLRAERESDRQLAPPIVHRPREQPVDADRRQRSPSAPRT